MNQLASMRPPQNAGEDVRHWGSSGSRSRCFNEAPAERGGRPFVRAARDILIVRGFNEAPAERGGRQPRDGALPEFVAVASMRPPQNAGEDGAKASEMRRQ